MVIIHKFVLILFKSILDCIEFGYLIKIPDQFIKYNKITPFAFVLAGMGVWGYGVYLWLIETICDCVIIPVF